MSVLKLLKKNKLQEEDLDSSGSDFDIKEDAHAKNADDFEPEESAFKDQKKKQWKNRSRVLVVTARGSAPGFRHLVQDMVELLPHSKKEVS
jgi:hypothetical protein